MKTIKGWPDRNVEENTCLVLTTGSETETRLYPSLEEAAVAFRALRREYPRVMNCSLAHRVNDFKSDDERELILLYKDDRREGWHEPCCDKHGRFYRGAFLRQTELHTVPGYGYMEHRKVQRDDLLPVGTARGDRKYRNPDPVDIGGALVDQQELNRIQQLTGDGPTHLTYMDYSGSFLYLVEIIWGDEPQIVASELAAEAA